MARSIFAFLLVATLFLSSTMAQSPASSPTKAPSPRKALSPSPTPAISLSKSPAASPSTGASPPESQATAPAVTPSSISAPPSEAPGPAHNGAILNRLSVTGSAAFVIFAAALLL